LFRGSVRLAFTPEAGKASYKEFHFDPRVAQLYGKNMGCAMGVLYLSDAEEALRQGNPENVFNVRPDGISIQKFACLSDI